MKICILSCVFIFANPVTLFGWIMGTVMWMLGQRTWISCSFLLCHFLYYATSKMQQYRRVTVVQPEVSQKVSMEAHIGNVFVSIDSGELKYLLAHTFEVMVLSKWFLETKKRWFANNMGGLRCRWQTKILDNDVCSYSSDTLFQRSYIQHFRQK